MSLLLRNQTPAPLPQINKHKLDNSVDLAHICRLAKFTRIIPHPFVIKKKNMRKNMVNLHKINIAIWSVVELLRYDLPILNIKSLGWTWGFIGPEGTALREYIIIPKSKENIAKLYITNTVFKSVSYNNGWRALLQITKHIETNRQANRQTDRVDHWSCRALFLSLTKHLNQQCRHTDKQTDRQTFRRRGDNWYLNEIYIGGKVP